MQYKALSLLQPWATLSVLGHKRIETRSRNTSYRGPLLIHASKGRQGLSVMDDPDFRKHLTPLFMEDPRHTFDYGAIIGMVNVFSTETTDALSTLSNWSRYGLDGSFELPEGLPNQERAFGDYTPGRYGYLLTDPIMFKEPISAKGMLGLWTPNEAISELVTAAIAAAKEGASS